MRRPFRPSFLLNNSLLRIAAGIGSIVLVAGVMAQTDTALIVPADTSASNLEQRVAGYSISASELDDELGSQDVSGILQGSRDVFNSTASFTFGQARFRI